MMMHRSRFLLSNPMRSTASMLGLGASVPMRMFSAAVGSEHELVANMGRSAIVAQEFSNAIFMPELNPARLRVPTSSGGYSFTMDNNDKINDFEQRVIANTEGDVRSFELLSTDNEANLDKMTIGQLKQGKFKMRINNKAYDVYPDLMSLVRDPAQTTKHKKEISKIEDINNSIPISR